MIKETKTTKKKSQNNLKKNKQIRDSLSDEEKYYRSLYQEAPLAYQSLSKNGDILNVNQKWLELSGYKKKDVIGKGFGDFLTPESRKYLKNKFPYFKKHGIVEGVEFSMLKKDGSIINILLDGSINKDKKGAFLKSHCIIRDVTKQKTLEEELKNSEEKYQSLFENASKPIILLEPGTGKIVQFNKLAYKQFGYSKNEFSKFSINDIEALYSEEEIKERLKIILKKGSAKFESKLMAKSGIERDVEIEAQKLTLNGIDYIQGIYTDITEKKILKNEKDILLEIFSKLTTFKDIKELCDNLVIYIKEKFDIEAVMIRLIEGNELTSMSKVGVNEKFNELDISILSEDKNGNIIRGPDGDPHIKCLCGKTLKRSTDPEFPHFNAKKSCWVNSVSESLKILKEEKKTSSSLIKLKKSGYESIATIEIGTGGKIVGLIHLYDSRKNHFSPEIISIFDRVVSHISLVISEKITEHSLIINEIKLKKIAREWEKTFDSIDSPISLIDINSRIIRCNTAQKEQLGVDFNDILGCTTHDLIHNGTPPPGCLLKKIKKTKKRDSRIFKKDSSWFQCTLDPILNSSGEVEGAVHILNDITDRKNAEEALKNSEERLKIIFESAPDAIYLYDLEGNFLDGNKAAEDLTGYKREELIGKSFLEQILLTEKEIPKAIKALEKSIAGKRTGPTEYLLKRKEGTLTTAEISSYPVKIDNKTVVLGVARDTSERKKIEEAMLLTQASVDNLTDAVYWMGPDAKFIYVNDAAVNALGYSKEKLLTMTVHDIGPDFPAKIWAAHWADLKKRRSFIINTLHQRKDGSTFPVEITVNLIQFGGKEFNCAIAKDITERKSWEEKLIKNQHFLSKAQEIGKIGTWDLDIQKDILTWTDENYSIFGITPGTEINYDLFINCIHPDDRDYVNEKWNSALKKEPYDIEHRIIVNSKVKWVREKADLEFDKKGNCISAVGIAQDITERRKAEDELKKQEEKIRSIFRSAPIGIGLVKNRNILQVNDRLCEMTGYTSDELINQSSRILYLTDQDYEYVGKEKYNQIKKYGTGTVETRFKRKDGKIIDVLLSSTPIDQDDMDKGVTFSALDITDRKKVETELKDSEEKFKNFIENNQAVMIQVHPETKQIVDCNIAAVKYYGYSKEKLLSMTVDKLNVLPVSEINNKIKKALENKSNCFNFKHKLANNEIRDVEVYASPIKTKNGMLMFSIIHDISERKNAEMRILKQQEFIQTAVNAVTHPFLVIDVKTKEIILKNKAASKFSDRRKSKCYNITHNRNSPCDGLSHPCPINEIIKTRKPTMMEHVHTDITGEEMIHEVYGFPIFDENGDVIQIIEYCMDITERKIAEENAFKQQKELIEADKMISLGILVSGVAHEINNPNNSILLNSQFLTKVWQDIVPILDKSLKSDPSIKIGGIKYDKLREKAPDLFSGISESSKRIKIIVEDLKRYARKDSFDEHTHVNVNSVIKSAVNLMSSFIKKSTNNFELQLDQHLPEIKANFQKIEQVIINLIQNSCQAISKDSDLIRISTETDSDKDHILITIKDEGIGIDQKDLKLVTEPFFTTKRESGGTGLGLSVSDKIIIDHRGKLSFDSKPGKGTIAKIRFPISDKDNDIQGKNND